MTRNLTGSVETWSKLNFFSSARLTREGDAWEKRLAAVLHVLKPEIRNSSRILPEIQEKA
jgi:hypothetical protein